MFNNQILAGAAGQGGSFYDYSIDQSLRFNQSDQPSLAKTYSTAQTNTKIITVSVWVKRGDLGRRNSIMFAKSGSSAWFTFDTDDKLRWNPYNTGYNAFKSTRVFRDPSAWYHIVATADSDTQSGANIYNVYVNGEQLTNSDGSSHVPDDTATKILANGLTTYIGDDTDGAYHFDGYMAEMHVIDGSVVAHTEFGETSNGVWVPKAYSGSYGNNGFYLSFADSSALGDDLSGNTNDFTATNLAASDVVPDSPTNNFATMNELQVQGPSQTAPYALSEGNLKMTSTANNYAQMSGAMGVQSGKWYTETYINSAGYPSWYIGWIARDRLTTFTGGNDFDGVTTGLGYFTGSNVYILDFGETNNVSTQVAYSGLHTAGDAPTTGDIIGCAVDFDDRKVWWSINGEWVDVGSGAGDPANGTNPTSTYTSSDVADDAYKFAWQLGYASTTKTINFGQDSTFAGATTAGGNSDDNGIGDFKYAPPSGFLALCSANLPEPTIGPNSGVGEQADDYFNTVLYTGNATARSITGVGFKPDWVWFKNRSAVQAHNVFDVNRGTGKILYPDRTDAEGTTSNHLNSFDSDGFTIGTATSLNGSGNSIVAWNWKAGGTAVSNSDGSLTCNVSANTDAGFSIVTWTANSDNGTLGHGLNSAPELIIAKPLGSGTNWYVMHTPGGVVPANNILNLDNANAKTNPGVNHFNDTYPTSTVFSYGGYLGDDLSNDDKVAYCFHSVDGFSRVTSYVGNASTDGTFCYLGHRPAWIMVKNASASGAWYIFDVERNTFNEMDKYLRPNLTNAEGTLDFCDFTSNGFKIRSSAAEWNGSGNTIIVLSFAEQPFKYANAR